jgi:hypothetical protein
LNYAVLGLERFENAQGLSLHMVVAMLPLEEDTLNYVLDIGTDSKRNRASIYLDGRGELCFRLFDGRGRRHLIRAGQEGCAYSYGAPTYLVFEVGTAGDETLLAVSAGDWTRTKILKGVEFPESELHYVMGSDVTGKALTHMRKMELVAYSRCLTLAEKEELRNRFSREIDKGYGASVCFEGNQFLHSQGHPNFLRQPAEETEAHH